MKRRRTSNRRAAFTLLELMLVVALSALLAAGAMLTLKGPYRRAQLENATERIALVDRQLRDHARRFGERAELVIDLGGGTLTPDYLDKKNGPSQPLCLTGNVRIRQVLYEGRRIEYGRVTVPYTAQGQTPTYGLRLGGARDASHWIIFMGRTGQPLRTDDDSEVGDVARLASSPGAHVD